MIKCTHRQGVGENKKKIVDHPNNLNISSIFVMTMYTLFMNVDRVFANEDSLVDLFVSHDEGKHSNCSATYLG